MIWNIAMTNVTLDQPASLVQNLVRQTYVWYIELTRAAVSFCRIKITKTRLVLDIN